MVTMNKLLTAGLVVTVAMTSSNASQNQCGLSGFYAELSAGLAMSKMKYKNDIEQLKVLYQKEPFMVKITSEDESGMGEGTNTEGAIKPNVGDIFYYKDELEVLDLKNQLQKKKSNFLCELGAGYMYKCGRFEFGLGINLGKVFGVTKKKIENLALTTKYLQEDALKNVVKLREGLKLNYLKVVGDTTSEVDATDSGTTADQVTSDLLNLINGTTNPLYPYGREFTIKCKNKVYVEFAPTIGFGLTGNVSLYVGGGVKYKSDKYTLKISELADEHKKTVSKIIPVIKAGIRVWIKDYFVKLECSHDFKKKHTFKYTKDTDNIDSGVKHTLENRSTNIKLGIGKVF